MVFSRGIVTLAGLLVAVGSVALFAQGRSEAPTTAAASACAATPPAELTARPAMWLGPCAGGRAEQLGVLRLGRTAPHQFFLGRMRAGKPVQGVLVLNASQLKDAVRFDARMNAVNSDPNRQGEIESVFRVASSAAAATARRFEVLRNPGSARFYRDMAVRYREPPFE
jgi:hypothetical protein